MSVSPNDELVNKNGPNAPGLDIKLGGCKIASDIILLCMLTYNLVFSSSIFATGFVCL